MWMCRGQRLPGVLFYHYPSNPLRQGPCLNLELDWQPASPSGPLSPSPTPELQVQACVNTSSFLYECWDLNSSPYACTAGILIAESPAPRPVTFARVLIVFLPA